MQISGNLKVAQYHITKGIQRFDFYTKNCNKKCKFWELQTNKKIQITFQDIVFLHKKDYEDIVGYQDLLFNIELGYYDGELLSKSENDNGIIVNYINNLKGKTIKIKQADGYIAVINTANLDEISIGEIKFVKWNKNSNIIQFKLLVEYALCDIVVGTVELTEDKQ